MFRYLILIVALLGVAGSRLLAFSSSPASETLRIYFSANREGEIEPCGCQVHQIGGLHRLQTFFDSRKGEAQAQVYLDSGDAFFPMNPAPAQRLEHEKLKAKLIARAFARFGLKAYVPGWRDFAAGRNFLAELEKLSGAAFVAANLKTAGDESPYPATHGFTAGGIKVGVLGLVHPEEFAAAGDLRVSDPMATARRLLPALRRANHVVVVLSRLGLEGDLELAKLPGIDLIVGSRSLDVLTQPERVGPTWVVQPQNQGQQIGVLDWHLTQPERIQHTLVDLGRELDRENEVHRWMQEFREQARQLALRQSSAAPPPSSDHPFVAHPHQCRTCHQKQHDFWAGTKHASAYLVLFAKNQHFDPQCIQCHSLGFQEEGGFTDIVRPVRLSASAAALEKSQPFVERLMKEVFEKDPGKGPLDSRLQPERHRALHASYRQTVEQYEAKGAIEALYIGVQCEHCHGNRHGHPGSGQTVKKVAETSCRKCHAPPHAAPYQEAMFARVACPLSSRP